MRRLFSMVGPAALVTFLFPAMTLAQTPARLPGKAPGWMPWVVAGAIVVVGCLAGFLNPKRSHLG